ncbi:MAG TPA: [Fe-S]-binding protein, partial [Chitinophagaceae bacterium]|nr:[Fe-S]-binding protein [Chitinophagaceae bacterium]
MKETAEAFNAKSREKAADLAHRKTINFNIGKYNAAVPQGKLQFAELTVARERAKNAKWRAIENLDSQLETFEAAISSRGTRVEWAEDAEQALDIVKRICQEKQCKSLVKSKSMVTEE